MRIRARRYIPWKKQGGRCYYCNNVLPFDESTLEHVIPLSKGGRSIAENLVAACRDCNLIKGNFTNENEVYDYAAKVIKILRVMKEKRK